MDNIKTFPEFWSTLRKRKWWQSKMTWFILGIIGASIFANGIYFDPENKINQFSGVSFVFYFILGWCVFGLAPYLTADLIYEQNCDQDYANYLGTLPLEDVIALARDKSLDGNTQVIIGSFLDDKKLYLNNEIKPLKNKI